MSGTTQNPDKKAAPRSASWSRFTVTGLEADLAYFHARREFIGEPDSTNLKAQIATFELLEESFNKILKRIKRKTGSV